MKKLVLSLIAVSALAFTTQAQTEKGKFVLGGNVEVNSVKNFGATKSDVNFTVLPSVGYFVSDNFAVGTAVGYAFSKDHTSATNIAKSSAFVVAPFARAYKNINDQFKFFGQLSVPLAFGNDKVSIDNGDNYTKLGKSTNVGVALSPGFAFFPSKKFGIEFSVKGLSYNDARDKDNNGNKIGGSKDFSLGANFLAPNIGVQFYL